MTARAQGTKMTASLRQALSQELKRRCGKNPSYSLRAFAKALAVDPATLSQILNGKRSVRAAKAEELARRAGVSLAPVALQAVEPAHSFSIDVFTAISEWYHMAILQLFKLKEFKSEPRWIARRLGVHVEEIKDAMARLERIGLIEPVKDGGWNLITDQVTTLSTPFTYPAFRKYQKQILEQAIEALEEVPIEKRDQSSMVMRFPVKRIQEAKEDLKNFRRSFCAKYENDQTCDEVYQLSLSFFPVTE